MSDAAPAVSLSNADAAQWNRDLMLDFQAALERNPAADLMSMFSDSWMHGSVFSHGDIRTGNIMVQQDTDISGDYVVTGIIDWEDSGFYPPYYECTGLTRTLSLVDEDDWYLHLPESVSPSKFPVRWLVNQLWQIHLKTT